MFAYVVKRLISGVLVVTLVSMGIFLLFWFELVSGVGFEDFWVVVFLIVYSLLSFGFRAQLGEGWRVVDPFSILFGFAARSAPLRMDESGLYRRNMLRDLDQDEAMPKALFGSIFVLLAATTLDNLIESTQQNKAAPPVEVQQVPQFGNQTDTGQQN